MYVHIYMYMGLCVFTYMIERVAGDVRALYFPCVGAICEDAAVFAVG